MRRHDHGIRDRRVGNGHTRSLIGKLQQFTAADDERHRTRRKRRRQAGWLLRTY